MCVWICIVYSFDVKGMDKWKKIWEKVTPRAPSPFTIRTSISIKSGGTTIKYHFKCLTLKIENHKPTTVDGKWLKAFQIKKNLTIHFLVVCFICHRSQQLCMLIWISEFHSNGLCAAIPTSYSAVYYMLTHVCFLFSSLLGIVNSYWAIETRWNQKLESIDPSVCVAHFIWILLDVLLLLLLSVVCWVLLHLDETIAITRFKCVHTRTHTQTLWHFIAKWHDDLLF